MQIDGYSYVSPHYTGADIVQKAVEEDNSLGIDEFLSLLAAQLANQDMMNPSSDTEFIAQLAQFSSLQAMDSMAKMTNLSQSTDLIGKTVIVAEYDSSGVLKQEQGVVERVILAGDNPILVINGKEFEYSNIMEIVNTVPEIETETTPEGDTTESLIGQATELIGKNVAIEYTDENDVTVQIEGIVEKVTFISNEPKLVIDGIEYSYSDFVKIIEETQETVPETTNPDATTNSGTEGETETP